MGVSAATSHEVLVFIEAALHGVHALDSLGSELIRRGDVQSLARLVDEQDVARRLCREFSALVPSVFDPDARPNPFALSALCVLAGHMLAALEAALSVRSDKPVAADVARKIAIARAAIEQFTSSDVVIGKAN